MVAYVLPFAMVEVREYLDRQRRRLPAVWSDRPNTEAAVKVAAALGRIQQGHLANAKRVREAVMRTGLTLLLTAEFTLVKKLGGSFSLWATEPKNVSCKTSILRSSDGQTPSAEKGQEGARHGSDTRIQENNPGTRKT